jgi:hypothetical protein
MFVEAIYQYNLLDNRIGFSVLGFLFFLSPFFLFFINRYIKFLTYIFVLLFLLCQGISPWLPTPLRIVSTGIGLGSSGTLGGCSIEKITSPNVYLLPPDNNK